MFKCFYSFAAALKRIFYQSRVEFSQFPLLSSSDLIRGSIRSRITHENYNRYISQASKLLLRTSYQLFIISCLSFSLLGVDKTEQDKSPYINNQQRIVHGNYDGCTELYKLIFPSFSSPLDNNKPTEAEKYFLYIQNLFQGEEKAATQYSEMSAALYLTDLASNANITPETQEKIDHLRYLPGFGKYILKNYNIPTLQKKTYEVQQNSSKEYVESSVKGYQLSQLSSLNISSKSTSCQSGSIMSSDSTTQIPGEDQSQKDHLLLDNPHFLSLSKKDSGKNKDILWSVNLTDPISYTNLTTQDITFLEENQSYEKPDFNLIPKKNKIEYPKFLKIIIALSKTNSSNNKFLGGPFFTLAAEVVPYLRKNFGFGDKLDKKFQDSFSAYETLYRVHGKTKVGQNELGNVMQEYGVSSKDIALTIIEACKLFMETYNFFTILGDPVLREQEGFNNFKRLQKSSKKSYNFGKNLEEVFDPTYNNNDCQFSAIATLQWIEKIKKVNSFEDLSLKEQMELIAKALSYCPAIYDEFKMIYKYPHREEYSKKKLGSLPFFSNFLAYITIDRYKQHEFKYLKHTEIPSCLSEEIFINPQTKLPGPSCLAGFFAILNTPNTPICLNLKHMKVVVLENNTFQLVGKRNVKFIFINEQDELKETKEFNDLSEKECIYFDTYAVENPYVQKSNFVGPYGQLSKAESEQQYDEILKNNIENILIQIAYSDDKKHHRLNGCIKEYIAQKNLEEYEHNCNQGIPNFTEKTLSGEIEYTFANCPFNIIHVFTTTLDCTPPLVDDFDEIRAHTPKKVK